jgi:hypothetical protein
VNKGIARSLIIDLLVILLIIPALVALWYAPSFFGGKILATEDIIGVYYALRATLHNSLTTGSFSLWNPVPGLGVPRLSNVQAGFFSPFSLLFYLLPIQEAMPFYPWLVVCSLGIFVYLLFRIKNLAAIPAFFGAFSWLTLGLVLESVQHFTVIETLVWLPAVLCCWESYLKRHEMKWAAAAVPALAFMICSGSPQILFYCLIVVAGWCISSLYGLRGDPKIFSRSLVILLLIFTASFSLAAIQLLPAFELMQRSQRTLLDASRFADTHRAAPVEIALSLVREVYLFIEPPHLKYGPLYRNHPGISLLTLLFALYSLTRKPRPWTIWAGVILFMAGMLGSSGLNVQVLLPILRLMRAPIRMFIPAAFLLSWLAARGMSCWVEKSPIQRNPMALLCIVWLLFITWSIQHKNLSYAPPEAFQVPEAVKKAIPRIAVDFSCPLFTVNSGLIDGIPTIMPIDGLHPRNYFEALFASQLGSLKRVDIIEKVITYSDLIPITHPNLPLMRAFNVRSTISCPTRGSFVITFFRNVPGPFFMVSKLRVVENPEERWALAASEEWDPLKEAIVSAPVPERERWNDREEFHKNLRILENAADRQVIEVSGKGGVLIHSALMYPGWKVWVDGMLSRPVEADLALRGVIVPPGTHIIEWRYCPSWLLPALILLVIGFLIIVFMALLAGRFRFFSGIEVEGKLDSNGERKLAEVAEDRRTENL